MAKKSTKCSSAAVGETRTVTNKAKGMIVTMKRVAKHGKNKNLCWQIIKSQKIK